jgi:voltage-gated potassium channel
VTLSRRRWAFVRSHPLALAAVALPLFQPLRLLRVVAALLLVGDRARLAPQIRVTTYVAGTCAGLLMFGSLAVLEVERDAPGATIQDTGDAVWWAFTTMTTVGYGDTAPTTGMGRLLAVGLMLSGIALLGVVTANIAAWFVSQFQRDEAEMERHLAAIAELSAEVRSLRAQITALTAQPPPAPDPVPAPRGGPAEPARSPAHPER